MTKPEVIGRRLRDLIDDVERFSSLAKRYRRDRSKFREYFELSERARMRVGKLRNQMLKWEEKHIDELIEFAHDGFDFDHTTGLLIDRYQGVSYTFDYVKKVNNERSA